MVRGMQSLQVWVTPELAQKIKSFRFKHEIENKSDAVREILERGLAVDDVDHVIEPTKVIGIKRRRE